MLAPPVLPNEPERLESLYRYGILDTEVEQAFDDVALLASQVCSVPTALISLLDTDRQWFKSKVGLDSCETPREISFRGHTILVDKLFIIEDAESDPRFSDNPLVTSGPRFRFYVGAPLTTPRGHRIGTLCVLDDKPNRLRADQERALLALARRVVALLEL